MPMIDVYATAGTFTDKHQLAADLAATLMAIEGVPDIADFPNTPFFTTPHLQLLLHPTTFTTNTNQHLHSIPHKQLTLISQFTSIITNTTSDPRYLPHLSAANRSLTLDTFTNTIELIRPASRSPSCRPRPQGPPPDQPDR